jgi:glycosyltransferase involved in cell wall biosynthesis
MTHPDIVLSAIVPVYNEESGLPELYRRLVEALSQTRQTYEILMVNDGSTDRSPQLVDQFAHEDAAVRAIHLSRNFGHQAALAAGLARARGQAIILLDADLQDPPEFIERLVACWREGYQVVYTQRIRRRGERLPKRIFAWAYYRFLRAFADVEVPTDAGDFCLLDRIVVQQLNRLPERNRYLRGLRTWVGFRQTALPYERAERYAGDAKYTTRKSLSLGVSGLLSFSKVPLRLATWMGLFVSLISFLLAGWFIVRKLTVGYEVQGWASTVVLVLFLGGVQLLTIGTIGEYLGRVYDEVKQRPLYIVDRITGQHDDPPWSATSRATASGS